MEKIYLTVAQASKLIGASRTMVYYYIEKGLPCEKRGIITVYKGKEWHSQVIHVDKDELLAFKLPHTKPTGRRKGARNKIKASNAFYAPKIRKHKACRLYAPHRKKDVDTSK